jgi:hypothetical protein
MSCQEVVINYEITETLTIRNDKIHAGTSREKISATLIISFNPHNLSPYCNTVISMTVKSARGTGMILQMIKIII